MSEQSSINKRSTPKKRWPRYVWGSALLVFVLLVTYFGVGHFAKGRAEEMLTRRTRGPVRIDSVSIGFLSLGLNGLHFEGPVLNGTVTQAEVHFRFWNLLRGQVTPTHVALAGGTLVVSPQAAPQEPSVVTSRQPASSEQRLEVEVRDIRFRLLDQSGELGQVHLVRLARTAEGPSDTEIELASVSSRGSDESLLTIGRVQVSRGREPGGLQASFDDVAVEVRQSPQELRNRWSTFIRDARNVWGAADADDAPATNTSFLTRVHERLAEGRGLSVNRLQFVLRDPNGAPASFGPIDLTLVKEGDELHTVGNPSAGGAAVGSSPVSSSRLSWNLRFKPEQLDVRGQLSARAVPLDVVRSGAFDLPFFEPSRTLLNAEVNLERTQDGDITFEGMLGAETLSFFHPRLSADPVTLPNIEWRGRGRYSSRLVEQNYLAPSPGVSPGAPRELISRRSIQLDDGEMRLFELSARGSGSAEWGGPQYRAALDFTVQDTGCNVALRSLPTGLLGQVGAFVLSGTIGGAARLRVDSEHLDDTVFDVGIRDQCRFDGIPEEFNPARFLRPFIHRVVDDSGAQIEFETGPGTAHWTPLSAISPTLIHAVLGHEDGGFFGHRGFNERAIRDALVQNLRAGRYVRGASTITMQLTKNVFLHREKTLARKLQEVILTWFLERTTPKAQLLELYLNVIEYGPGVYGIGPATVHYFGERPADLSVSQAAFLAMILPNPPRYGALAEAGSLPSTFQARMNRFVDILVDRGRFSREASLCVREESSRFAFRTGPSAQRCGFTSSVLQTPDGEIGGAFFSQPFQESEMVPEDDSTSQHLDDAYPSFDGQSERSLGNADQSDTSEPSENDEANAEMW